MRDSRTLCPETGHQVQTKSIRRTHSHRMKFCVQKRLGDTALNKQTAGNVSVYEHTHCLPDSKTIMMVFVTLHEIVCNSNIRR